MTTTEGGQVVCCGRPWLWPAFSACVVVDPGPLEDGHLERLTAEVGDVGLVLLTHHHLDHAEVAAEFARRKGCAVRALEPSLCVDAAPLTDGEDITVDGLALRVLTTPGHTADSISLVLPGDGALLTGDMVLGRGTTVVAHPDGQLGPYFDSITRMRELVLAGEVRTLWPAHGPVLDDALGVLDYYLAHRRERLAQVEAALRELGVPLARDPGSSDLASRDLAEDDALPRRVVEVVYGDVDTSLWGAAELSVRAQLAFLSR